MEVLLGTSTGVTMHPEYWSAMGPNRGNFISLVGLAEANFFSKIDTSNAFHTCPVDNPERYRQSWIPSGIPRRIQTFHLFGLALLRSRDSRLQRVLFGSEAGRLGSMVQAQGIGTSRLLWKC